MSRAKTWFYSPLKNSSVKHHKLTYEEEKAIIEFIGFAMMDSKYWLDMERIIEWPAFRSNHKYWTDAAKQIQTATGSNILLTSKYLFS